ncbi:hypothetical protein CPB85DRAFT_1430117 [Mucidula mucida]|nr:hypothetical protein CPB85DRAFT_1430117 [Mucidula mucida]
MVLEYNVRATARTPKVETLKNTYPDAQGRTDLVSDAEKWPEILKGMDAIIHIAGPVYHLGTTSDEIYNAFIGGTRKLFDGLAERSVKRFVLTSSIAAFFKPDFNNIMDKTTYDHNIWSDIDDIDPKQHEPSYTYVACKAISDKLLWKAAEKYTHIDFTTVFPPTIYGCSCYELIQKGVGFPTWPITTIAHNRDVAKAHVLALTAPALPKGEKKRLIVSLGTMTWVEAIAFLQQPEVVAKFTERGHDILARLPDVSKAGIQSQYGLDTSLTEEVLGLKKEDYIPWQELLLEVMQNLMDWEKAHPAV